MSYKAVLVVRFCHAIITPKQSNKQKPVNKFTLFKKSDEKLRNFSHLLNHVLLRQLVML